MFNIFLNYFNQDEESIKDENEEKKEDIEESIYADRSFIESESTKSYMKQITDEPYMPNKIRIQKQMKSYIDNSQSPSVNYKARSSSQTPTPIRNNFQRITEVSSIDSYFNNKDFMNSIALDILCMYIKGQKTLYTEAKTYCEQQLNFLMLPAIFISSTSSVLSFVFNSNYFGAILISSLTALNAFILAVISYLKLDAKAQAHKTSAYKYEKLESLCQFNSGKNLFFEDVNEILGLISSVEKDVNEIKEINQYILPEYIRYKYSILYSTNIFSIVKKIQSNENKRKTELQNNINKMFYKTRLYDELLAEHNEVKSDKLEKEIIKLQNEIEILEVNKNQIIKDLMNSRDEYFELDKQLRDEIDQNVRHNLKKWNFCNWLKS